MTFDINDIISKHILSKIDEDVGDYLAQKVSEHRKSLNIKNGDRKYFNREHNILSLIRRKKYEKAVKMIIANKVNPFSLFNDVQVFGNTYNGLPFIAAALALSVEKTKDMDVMTDKITKVLTDVFAAAGINSSNMFDAKFSTPNGSSDVLTFVLTHDGEIKPKDYKEESDLDMLVILNSILKAGYTLTNISGIIKIIIDNDMISSLKFLIDSGKYTPKIDDIKIYSIKEKSNIGEFLGITAAHPFKLHSPEVEYDDKGKFAGGQMYQTFKNVGYDISKVEKNQKIHASVAWMIRDYLNNVLLTYKNSGENFTNETDLNLYDGSEFNDATENLKYLCAEYYKFIQSNDIKSLEENERKEYMRTLIDSVNVYKEKLQDGINKVLKNINLPEVEIVFQNDLKPNDSKILYKTAPLIKELWNSVKVAK